MSQKIILNSKEIHITLHRLACQLIENHTDFSNTVLIGIQPRGIFFARRIIELLKNEYQISNVNYGELDITFYRDDFRRREEPLQANQNNMNTVIVENKKVVFIDDVLFSGRSIRAALTAIQAYGRPKNIELMVLIDRRFSRSLPIQPDYLGMQVDAINEEKVKVSWKEKDEKDSIYLVKNK